MENRDIRGFFVYMRCSIEAVRGEYIIRREMREAAAERSFPRSEKGGSRGRRSEAAGAAHSRSAHWLDEAGESLEQGADIKGDLKVMLAQAELARAKETQRPPLWRRCGRRVLPLATALAVLSLGLFLRPAVAPPEDQALSSPSPAAAVVPQASVQGQEQADSPAPAALQKMQGQAAKMQAAGEPARAAVQETASPPQMPSAVAVPAVSAQQRETPAARPPSPETQKLMQSAGKALRAS